MEKSTKVFLSVFQLLCLAGLIGFTAGCASKEMGADEALAAIDTVRTTLGLPLNALEFVGEGSMLNSPSGDLKVAIYQDAQGRRYFLDPQSGRVVEIDARALLPGRSEEVQAESAQVLESLAGAYAQQLVPDFEARSASLAYEAGDKGDHYFFTWYGEINPGDMNRPFLQFGLHNDGMLFAYYNTLDLQD